jgi:Ecdysteroid kinase-like family
MKIPATAKEIDADWLTRALAENYPGTKVTLATHGIMLHGTASKIRLMLEYNDAGHAHGLPPTLWWKGGLEAHSVHEHVRAIYETEALFYRRLAPRVASMQLPRCYASVIDPDTGCSAILLEDLLTRNARFGIATSPATPRLAANVLAELARLHGSFWQDPLLKNDALLAGGMQRMINFLDAYLFTEFNWQRCIELPRGANLPHALRDRERMQSLVHDLLRTDEREANTLLHGDDHLGNVCILPGEKTILLDWQATMSGHWAHDVAYFLTAAMTVEDRRRHERELIAHYARELVRAGGKVDESTAWYEYRRHALYTCCWFLCNPEWVVEAITAPCSQRAFAAFEDLDTLGCFG